MSRLRSNNTSGVACATRTSSGKWRVSVAVGGIRKYLGTFPNLKEALKAREDFRKKHAKLTRKEAACRIIKVMENRIKLSDLLSRADRASIRRRRSIIQLISQGLSQLDVADELGINPSLVSKDLGIYLENVIERLQKDNEDGRYNSVITECEKTLHP